MTITGNTSLVEEEIGFLYVVGTHTPHSSCSIVHERISVSIELMQLYLERKLFLNDSDPKHLRRVAATCHRLIPFASRS